MAKLLYFLPRAPGIIPDRALLEPLGLWGVLDSRGLTAVQSDGPGGCRGLLVTDSAEPADRQRYVGALQVWTPEVAAEPRWHVGAWTDALPGPADLLRDPTPIGWPVTLGDGRAWTIPVARSFPEGTQLPATLILGPAGLSREIRPEFAALSALGERLWGVFETGGTIPYEDLFRGAVQALGINYRVGAAECNLLKLFQERVLVAVGEALVDMPTVREVAEEIDARKKAEAGENPAIPGGSGSGSGAPADSRATTRPLPTSTG